MPNQPYIIPQNLCCYTEEIKKSKFITLITHTQGKEEAKAFIRKMKKKYADARHHCWAYIAYEPTNLVARGCSDDGEPSGTAGKPMLDQIAGANIGEITVVVVRYFGGIHLGTGGLVRAYGGGVKKALNQLETKLKVPRIGFSFHSTYDFISLIEEIVKRNEGAITCADYQADVHFQVLIPYANEASFLMELENRSRGRIIPTVLN